MSTARDDMLALEARTAAHYDAYPFEFLTPADERQIEGIQPPSFLQFAAHFLRPGARACEIGCGPGRATMYLSRKGACVTALDISGRSLLLARNRAREAEYVQGSVLSLPFGDGCFEVVICDGVIHHTPDARGALAECARVMRPGAALYLGVYNRRRYYYYVYTYLGAIVRRLETRRSGRMLIYSTVFPLYYFVHLLKSGGKRTLRGARNFFYDYLITPQASFHRREEIEAWASALGLQIVDYDKGLGNVHTFVLVKPAQRSS